MTDREMLELAAIAYTDGHCFGFDNKGNALLDPIVYRPFNPLVDDGDALRLAVVLGLRVITPSSEPVAVADQWPTDIRAAVDVIECDSKEDAVRRAITRAAAEIGRGI